MQSKLVSRLAGVIGLSLLLLVACSSPDSDKAKPPAGGVVEPAVAPASEIAAVPAGVQWPREVTLDGNRLVFAEPVPDALEGVVLHSRGAVMIYAPGKSEPGFGAIDMAATLGIDRDSGYAYVDNIVVEGARFPTLTEAQIQQLSHFLQRDIPQWGLRYQLNELRQALAAGSSGVAGLRDAPPVIRVVTHPAVLVSLDGEPRLRGIAGTPYERVVNTVFPIAHDPATGRYWFYGSSVWFNSYDLLKGPWNGDELPPEGIRKLFPSADSLPAAGGGADIESLRKAEIIVATVPTELIVVEGPPQYKPLVGNDLQYVANSGTPLFLDIPDQNHYVVLSGRWYRSPSLMNGPWQSVANDKLPAEFSRIPENSPRAGALVYIAGTQVASEALMDSMLPQTASVRRDQAKFEASYDGPAQFEPIPEADLSYAVNTESQVLRDGDLYYAVEDGIWYVSESPNGPWRVADMRPQSVDRIPPSYPVYNTRYVYIYDSTPEVVFFGYLPGYLWAFPHYGAMVYGTGYYYRPYYGYNNYYPRHHTWGFHVSYNPWSGWGYGLSWTSGWLSLSFGWGSGWGSPYYDYWDYGYYPGYWSGCQGAGWFGPGGYRPPYPYPSIGYGPGEGAGPEHPPGPPLAGGGNNIYARPRPEQRQRPIPRPGQEIPPIRPAPRPLEPSKRLAQRPIQRPELPATRPMQPSERPLTRPTPSDRPVTRPTQQPERQWTRPTPSDRPVTRPMQPSERPSPRPPSERPSTRSWEYRAPSVRPPPRPAAPPSMDRPSPRPAGSSSYPNRATARPGYTREQRPDRAEGQRQFDPGAQRQRPSNPEAQRPAQMEARPQRRDGQR